MEKIVVVSFIVIFLAGIAMLSGCSPEKTNTHLNQGDIPESKFSHDKNMTNEDMQKMFEERQHEMVAACEGKDENDSCQINDPQGEAEGICKTMNEIIVCTTNRSMNMPTGRPGEQRVE